MDFALTQEQEMIVRSVRRFVEQELYPHEEEVERLGHVRPELAEEVRRKAIEKGFYAANMPEDLGGGGLDMLTGSLMDRELGRASYALHYIVARPSNILRACAGAQVEEYLLPTIRGERQECVAMSEPETGSDLRSMHTTASPDGGDYVINGTKHFISKADISDYVILFAATGENQTPRGPRKRVTAFLVDMGTPGFTVREGYRSLSHRGYNNRILEFDDCRVPADKMLGELDRGFETAKSWLGTTRIQVGIQCIGRAQRALEIATEWAATRQQFGQSIGKFQGVGFKLADMATEIAAAELLILNTAWRFDRGIAEERDIAMAKLFGTEVLGRVADNAVQILGGMGVMEDLPIARIWRDARVERIWDGTSEIQRHIISRAMLRPYEN
jgi:acyl-CoA dehydrogenase